MTNGAYNFLDLELLALPRFEWMISLKEASGPQPCLIEDL